MSVLAKATQVIEALVAADGPVRLGDIATEVGLPKSSLHRLLAELTELGLARGEDGVYRPGYRLVNWGHAADRSLGIRDAAEPLMRDLAKRAGEAVQLHVAEGTHRVCVASVPGPQTLQPLMPIGNIRPLGAGAAGKLLLAHADDGTREAAWQEANDRARDLWAAPEELATLRERGWNTSISEMEVGLTVISATVPGRHGRAIAALSIAGAGERLTEQRRTELLPALLDTAASISRALMS